MANRKALTELLNLASNGQFASDPPEEQERIFGLLENDPEKLRGFLTQVDPTFANLVNPNGSYDEIEAGRKKQNDLLYQMVDETSVPGMVARVPVAIAGSALEATGGVMRTYGLLTGNMAPEGYDPGTIVAGAGKSLQEWAAPVAHPDSYMGAVSSGLSSMGSSAIALMAGGPAAVPLILGAQAGGQKANQFIDERIGSAETTGEKIALGAKALGIGAATGAVEAMMESVLGTAQTFKRLEEASKFWGTKEGARATLKAIGYSLAGEMAEEQFVEGVNTILDNVVGSGAWNPNVPLNQQPGLLQQIVSQIDDVAVSTAVATVGLGAGHRLLRNAIRNERLPDATGAGGDPDDIIDLSDSPIDRIEALRVASQLNQGPVTMPPSLTPEGYSAIKKQLEAYDRGDEGALEFLNALPAEIIEPAMRQYVMDKGQTEQAAPAQPVTVPMVEVDRDGSVTMAQPDRAPMVIRTPSIEPESAPEAAPEAAQEMRASVAGPGDKAKVQAQVSALTRGWAAGAPQVVVHQTVDEARQATGQPISDGMAGVLVGGTVHMAADNISGPVTVERVLAHEVAAHHGLEQTLGKDLLPVLAQVSRLAKTDEQVKRIAERVRGMYPGAGQVTTAKEVLAALAETLADEKGLSGALKALGDRIVGAVNRFIRGLGFKVDLSRAEVMSMLRSAYAQAQSGKIGAKPGTQFMYIGTNAATWGQHQAKQFMGLDNQPRARISDKGASINVAVLRNHGPKIKRFKGTMGQILNHPNFFAAYPHLANVPVDVVINGIGGGVRGSTLVDNRGNVHRISVYNAVDAKGALETLLHELQHGVQGVEGWASGSSLNPDPARILHDDPLLKKIEAALSAAEAARDKAQALGNTSQVAAEEARIAGYLQDRANQVLMLTANVANYARSAGEIEARDTTATANLDQAALDQTQPYRSQTETDLSTTKPEVKFDNAKGKFMMLTVKPKRKMRGITMNEELVQVEKRLFDGTALVKHVATGQILRVNESDLGYAPPEKTKTTTPGPGAINTIGLVKLFKRLLGQLRVGEATGYDALKILANDKPPTFGWNKNRPTIRMTWDYIAKYPGIATRVFAENLGQWIDWLDSSLPLMSEVRGRKNLLGQLIRSARYAKSVCATIPMEGVNPAHTNTLNQLAAQVWGNIPPNDPNPVKTFQRMFSKELEKMAPTIGQVLSKAEHFRILKHAKDVATRVVRAIQGRSKANWKAPGAARMYAEVRSRVYAREMTRVLQNMGLAYMPTLKAELAALSEELYGDRTAIMKPNQLYSAFIGAYLTNPIVEVDGKNVEAVRWFAPNFLSLFEQYRARMPEFDAAVRELRAYMTDTGAWTRDIADAIDQADTNEAILNAKVKNPEGSLPLWHQIKRIIWNRAAVMFDALVPLPAEQVAKVRNAVEMKQAAMSWSAEYMRAIDRSLAAMSQVPHLMRNLKTYIFLRRIAAGERIKNVTKQFRSIDVNGNVVVEELKSPYELANPYGAENAAQAAEQIDDMFKAPDLAPHRALFEQFEKDYVAAWQKYITEPSKEYGVYGDALIKAMEDNKHYATFMVIDHMHQNGASRVAYGNLHEQFGTFKDIVSPIAATMAQAAAITYFNRDQYMKRVAVEELRAADPTKVRNAVKDFQGRFMPPKNEASDPVSWQLVEYMHKGEMKGVYLPWSIAEALKDPALSPVPQWISGFHRWYRRQVTSFSPTFVGRNPIRDFLDTVLNVHGFKNRSLPVYAELQAVGKFLGSLFDAFTGGISEQEREYFAKHGISWESVSAHNADANDTMAARMGQAYELTAPVFKDEAKLRKQQAGRSQLIEQSLSFLEYLWSWTGGLAGSFTQGISGRFEKAGKLTGYRFYKPYLDAGVITQDEFDLRLRNEIGTPNGLNAGTINPMLKEITLFGNMQIQGTVRNLQLMKNSPRVLFKRLGFAAGVTMLNFMLAYGWFRPKKDDEEPTANEWMHRMVDWYDQANYINLCFGIVSEEGFAADNPPEGEVGPRGKALYMKIPLDQTTQMMTNTMFRMLHSENGIKALASTVETLFEEVPQPSPLWVGLIGGGLLAAGINPTSVSGYPLVNQEEWDAGGTTRALGIAKAAWNWSAIGANVYRFKATEAVEVKTELEQLVGFPIAQRYFDTFFKISNKGLKDEVTHLSERYKQQSAQIRHTIRRSIYDNGGEVLDSIINEESLTPEQIQWFNKNGPEFIQRTQESYMMRGTMDRWLEEYMKADEVTRALMIEQLQRRGGQ